MRPRVLTMDYINVPMALLQEVKEDPLQWSLVALSVAMKCLSPSSTYIFTSEKKFRGDFHLGYTKARNLLEAIREGNSLFQMTTCPNGRTIIVARSLKKMYASRVILKDGRKSLEMVVGKVRCCTRENLHVTEIESEMRQLLLLTNISAKTREGASPHRKCFSCGKDHLVSELPGPGNRTQSSHRQSNDQGCPSAACDQRHPVPARPVLQ